MHLSGASTPGAPAGRAAASALPRQHNQSSTREPRERLPSNGRDALPDRTQTLSELEGVA
jgi:hypothetical protein